MFRKFLMQRGLSKDDLLRAVASVASEIGVIFRAEVHTPGMVESMLRGGALPKKPFHTVLCIDVGEDVPFHFAYARMTSIGVLEVFSFCEVSHHAVISFVKTVCKQLGICLSRKIVPYSVRESFGNSGCSAASSINALAKALGSVLSFTQESLLLTGLQMKREPCDLGASFDGGLFKRPRDCEDAEGLWNRWVVGLLSVPPEPCERILENHSRILSILHRIVVDVYGDIPVLYGVELLKKWDRFVDLVVNKTLAVELYDLEERFGNMVVSGFAETWRWISALCCLLPLVECKGSIPQYKRDFYSKAAKDGSGCFFGKSTAYAQALLRGPLSGH